MGFPVDPILRPSAGLWRRGLGSPWPLISRCQSCQEPQAGHFSHSLCLISKMARARRRSGTKCEWPPGNLTEPLLELPLAQSHLLGIPLECQAHQGRPRSLSTALSLMRPSAGDSPLLGSLVPLMKLSPQGQLPVVPLHRCNEAKGSAAPPEGPTPTSHHRSDLDLPQQVIG